MSTPLFIDIHTHNHILSEYSIFVQNIFIQDILTIKEKKYKNCSVGLHPWHIDLNNWNSDLTELEKLIPTKKNIIAIGETGLDRLKGPPLQDQQYVFQKHLEISKKFKLPVIIHCVKAWGELLQIHAEVNPSQPWIVHGFNQNLKIANQLLQKKIFLSFGKALLNENSNASIVFPSIPLECIFLETDDSDFTIREIYERAAFLSNVSIEKLSLKIQHNFNEIFTPATKTYI